MFCRRTGVFFHIDRPNFKTGTNPLSNSNSSKAELSYENGTEVHLTDTCQQQRVESPPSPTLSTTYKHINPEDPVYIHFLEGEGWGCRLKFSNSFLLRNCGFPGTRPSRILSNRSAHKPHTWTEGTLGQVITEANVIRETITCITVNKENNW